jgi:hypothetical protein
MTNRLPARGSLSLRGWIASSVWVASYILEESRQRYAASGQLWRRAGACLLLGLLRLGGMRDA